MFDKVNVEASLRIKSELLLKLRLDRGWTQEEVADKIGVDARTYRRYERTEIGVSHRAAQYEILRCIAAVFQLAGPEVLLAQGEQGTRKEPLSSERPPRSARSLGSMEPLQPPDAPFRSEWYVNRDREETEALNKLRSAVAPVVLQGPHLYGKGTLLSYLLERSAEFSSTAGRAPCHVLRINVASLGPDALSSLDALLRMIGRSALSLVEQVDAEEAERHLQKVWQRPGSAANKLTRLLRHDILDRGPFLLALEKVERLHGCSFQDDFFALLRGWAEKGAEAPWSQLRMLLTISTEPTLLDSLDHSSFFALASPIRLGGLTPEQVERMASLHGLPAGSSVRMDATLGGHPYLVRLALYQAVVRETSVDEILNISHGAGPFLHHLKSLHRFVEENQLFGTLGGVLADPGYALSFRDYCRLYSQGLIYEERPGTHRLRCGLYEQYFGPLCRRT